MGDGGDGWSRCFLAIAIKLNCAEHDQLVVSRTYINLDVSHGLGKLNHAQSITNLSHLPIVRQSTWAD